MGIVGEPAKRRKVKTWLSLFPKVNVILESPSGYEMETLSYLHNWSKNHQAYIFYAHTKGVTWLGDPFRNRWRDVLEWNTIGRWRECVRALEDGKDAAGCMWLTPQEWGDQIPNFGDIPYFGGNYWWSTTEFISTLPEVDKGSDPYYAERWLGLGAHPPDVLDLHPGFPSWEVFDKAD